MATDVLASPLFGITLTLATYFMAQRLYLRSGLLFLNPVAVSMAAIILFLLGSDIPFEAYANGGRYILFLLGPAVVALAVPLYQRRAEILARKGSILVGVGAGAIVSIVTASGTAWLLGGSREVVLSLAPKSVTTPIAIGLAEVIGGVPSLTAVIVVLTGCIGAIAGPEICRLFGIRDPFAVGLAVGTASHGIGTARMLEVDRLGGAASGLAIGLNGLITALLLSVLALFL
jgi:predicted murein hydrolase (TIGR00659 family)